MRKTTRLRTLIGKDKGVLIPGVSDALFAQIVARHGYDALYMTGAGTSATRLGRPDVGLLTLGEMVDNASRIANSVDIPLISDADNGYGGPLNVRRTIQEFERHGIAGVHLEDQVLPKRCGHLAGKQLISRADMVAKLKAATDARLDDDFVIIARTDAIAVEGFDAAIERAVLYREAGADMIFVEAPSMAQLPEIPRLIDAPLLYNMAASGKTPFLSQREIAAMGFDFIIYPNWMMLAAIKAADSVAARLRASGEIATIASEVPTFQEFFDLAGMQEIRELEERYGVPEEGRAGY